MAQAPSPRREPKRSVIPRKPAYIHKSIIAVDKANVLLESGEVFEFSELPGLIRSQPSSIIAAVNMGMVIKYLDSQFSGDPMWQFRVTPVMRSAWLPDGQKRKATVKETVVNYFGFKGEGKKKGKFHYPISPHSFVLKSLAEIHPGPEPLTVRLMEWAEEIRSFLMKYNLNLSPTSGGIGAQLLRDKKFYPEPRRKVPRHTNAFAREHLPGNFYKLYETFENQKHRATYLDQTSAHHNAAAKVRFPCANTLRRKGRHKTLTDRPYARFGTEKYKQLIGEFGLFYLAVEVPQLFKRDFPLPAYDGPPGYRRVYVYSNELPYLESSGIRIRHIIAQWTSPDLDHGINRYGKWAMQEIRRTTRPSARLWLKPTLLSTYGVLAAKPKIVESGYKTARNATAKQYPCGSGFLDVQAKTATKLREPNMANVIHRGMIEAQTRLESLEFARRLASEGHTILAIYADSVFVTSDKPLPLLPPLWKVERHLNNLRFQSSTHFTSDEVSKQPGLPENFRERARLLPPRPRLSGGKRHRKHVQNRPSIT